MNRENRNALRRCERARKFPDNTCPASRTVFLLAERAATVGSNGLLSIPVINQDRAGALFVTVEALWKARTEIDRLKKKLEERS